MVNNKKINTHLFIKSGILFLLAALIGLLPQGTASAAVQNLVFPVIGSSSYSDDFNAPRSNGTHRATDIIASKHQKIVSASNGTIQYVTTWDGAGYSIRILGTDGYTYNYYHINNDTPGTDDGAGGKMNAFAPDVEPGNPVVRGQFIGYVGDSGNSETTVPHLHFEIYKGSTPVNPYSHLNSAVRITTPRAYPKLANELLPYGSGSFRGGARIVLGDIDGDGFDETIVGAGEGGKYVKVFNQAGQQISSFMPNGSSFTGGVDVAAADIDGDNNDEIVTGAGKGGKYVKVFEANGTLLNSFIPNGDTFTGGVDVAAADIDGDNNDEIVTGAGKGGKYVKVFEANGTAISRFLPYGNFEGGISVAGGDVSADPGDEIVTGAGPGSAPLISVFTEDGTQLKSYNAYASDFRGGIRVEVAELDNTRARAEIASIAESDGSGRVKLFTSTGSTIGYSDYASEDWWRGHNDVAVSMNRLQVSLNITRRTSIRSIDY